MAEDNKVIKTDFDSLDEDAWKQQEVADDEALRRFINPDVGSQPGGGSGGGLGTEFDSFMQGASIDQRGKADDAIDFEDMDLSDDDLPDEEPNTGGTSADLPGLTDDGGTSNDTDDLFGDLQASSPLDGPQDGLRSSPHPLDVDTDQARLSLPGGESMEELRYLNFDHDTSSRDINQDPDIPAPPESEELLVKLQWPGFEKGAILNWNELLRPKQAIWNSKKPAKLPKPLIPTKLSLELDADQEKLFRIPGTATQTVLQRIRDAEIKGLISCETPEPLEQAELEVFNMDEESDSEMIGGFTMRDIATLCDDWDSMIVAGDAAAPTAPAAQVSPSGKRRTKDAAGDEEELWDEMFLDEDDHAAKKRRVEPPKGLPEIPRFTAPNFDNFREVTAKLGKRVILDRNDPYLLIDDMESERASKRRKVQHKMVRMANGRLAPHQSARFNFSSDGAYEALKENHSHKVRISPIQVQLDHSLPAQRLQWPYYKVKLPASDPHSYHRPQLQTRKVAFSPIKFGRPNVLKRKALKSKKIEDIYREAKDLSMNDNSTAVLFEYCEEIPTVLSNFGMGSKIVNYYRRSNDSEGRPEKREFGEPHILLPEDRSPFSIFCPINPGETVPTFYTQMYRAPVFQHNPRNTDFLVGRSTTGLGGSTWYIRNIDHLFVVGQNLPSVVVPGPHSRKVTNVAKNRLKMVAYRLLRKHERVTLRDITKHVAESNESQNRAKLKEFVNFRKETKDWEFFEGDEGIDEAKIRALVKPEDVCLLDAMQVGVHELENGGYEMPRRKQKERDRDEDDLNLDDSPTDPLIAKMAPWKTTKAFIDATLNKGMLAIHGAGDPTGRGLGISFLKTSMKGGFLEQLQGPLATSADAIERQRKANNGHRYNVKDQACLYTQSIKDIWNRQRESLEDTQEHDDEDVQPQEDEDERFNVDEETAQAAIQAAAQAAAQAEGLSQVSRSAASTMRSRRLHISRTIKRADGSIDTITEIVHDPVVIAQYIKKRRQLDIENIE